MVTKKNISAARERAAGPRERILQALKESQREYGTLLSNLPGMVYRCRNDKVWTMEFASEGCLNLTGFKPSDFVEQKVTFSELIHPEDQNRIWDEIQKAVLKNARFQLTYRIRTAEGKEKWVWEQGRSVELPDGRSVLEGFITDVTQQMKLQEATRHGRERLRVLTDSLPVLISYIDSEQRLRFANARYDEWFGIKTAEYRGRHIREILGREGYGKSVRHIAAVLKGEARSFEETLRFNKEPGERSVRVDYIPDLVEGKVRGFFALVSDITSQKKQQEELEKNEQQFRLMVENLPAGAVYVEGDSIRFNRKTEEITGYSQSEITSLDEWFQKLYGDRAIMVRGIYERDKAAGFREPTVVPVTRKDGGSRMVRFAGYKFDEQAEVWLIDDVTERELAREELQKEKDFVESLIETAQAIVLVLDTAGKIIRFNPYMEQISGYRLDEVRGKDWFTTFVPERERDRIRELFYKTEAQVESRGLNAIITWNGEERLIEWASKSLKGLDGTLIGVLSIGQDVTEQHEIEDELRKNESWLRSLIETTQDAVVSIDGEGRIGMFNRAAERIFGYDQTEIRGEKVNLLMPDPFSSEHDDYIRRYEKTGEARVLGRVRTLSGKRKSGEVFPIELSVVKIDAGEEVSYAAFIRDISEKSALQEKLIETERLAAVGATTASLAHEIRNPLNGMYISAQLLQRRLARQRVKMDEGIESNLRNLIGEITRLNHLLEEFNSFARREKYHFQPCSVATLCAEVYAMEQESFKGARVRIEQDIAPESPLIWIDKDRLKQALLNLCRNASEAMPGGGTITFRARHTDQEVYLEIGDTGLGIPEGINIYEPFNTTKPAGAGLGLMVVRKIVAAHGGSITHESEPGRGTTFRITLPVKPPGSGGLAR